MCSVFATTALYLWKRICNLLHKYPKRADFLPCLPGAEWGSPPVCSLVLFQDSRSEGQLVRGNFIRLGYRTQGTAGNSRRHHPGGNIPGDHTAGTNHRPFADGDTAADHRVGADPDVFFQGDGFRGADPLGALTGIDGMTGAAQAYPGGNEGPAPMLTGEVSRITQL